ncbi:TetR/AcrR family transcriptional regulator [Nocardia gamkensis]|uniref:TetR/AcrR family transcriptional regulator n=1 Tax=Nocardia gamkensis TaxID=352869 RepID=UPI0036E10FE2
MTPSTPAGCEGPQARRSRTYDPVQTRQLLIAAGIHLFSRQGFHATSVREITDVAGVTKGAFYHHFGSKEELLHTIHDEFIDFHLAGQNLIVARSKTAHERLFHLVRLLVLVVAEYQQQVAVWYQEQKALTGPEFAEVRAKRAEARHGVVEAIEAGIANGEFRDDLDATTTALGILGMGNWTYQWYSPRSKVSVEEIGRTYGLMALRSLSVRPELVETVEADDSNDPVREMLSLRRVVRYP